MALEREMARPDPHGVAEFFGGGFGVATGGAEGGVVDPLLTSTRLAPPSRAEVA